MKSALLCLRLPRLCCLTDFQTNDRLRTQPTSFTKRHLPASLIMQRVSAMIWLTLKAASRYRLIWVLTALLIGGVVILPVIVKDDGSARGITQILLTYTLALTTSLLGFATLWMACGTLARDVEECQIQVVAVKPISRWEIWLGKFFGIMALNAILIALAGVCIYGLLQWRAQQLPEKQREVLRNEVLVARGSVRGPIPDYESQAELILQNRLKEKPVSPEDAKLLRTQIRTQVKAASEIVPPGTRRPWVLDMRFAKDSLKGQPLYLRIKFNAAQTSQSGTFVGIWRVGDFDSPRVHEEVMSLAPDTFHEFKVPSNLIDEKGNLTVNFINQNDTALLFSLEDGFEVLYRQGGFGLNFVRGLCIVFFWLMFLAAVGLAASSFLSFPVASFVSIGVLIVGFSSGTISQVIEQGTIGAVNHETGVADHPAVIDYVALPIFKALLNLIKLVEGFSPIDSLSTGRSIGWLELGRAFLQICILLSGLVCGLGIWTFSRRELATAQGTS